MKRVLIISKTYCCLPIFACLLLLVSPVYAGQHGKRADEGLQKFLRLGLQENLGMQVVLVDFLKSVEEVTAQDARFDPEIFSEASHTHSHAPVSDPSIADRIQTQQSRGEIGVRKTFESGLSSSLSFVTERVEGDYEYLDPRYTSYLLLDLQQPLLRDFGTNINSSDLTISKHQQQQRQFSFINQAQDLTLQIEVAYYDIIKARKVELLRLESRRLAADLLTGNRAKLQAGVIPVSEVQEAETALASRELQLAFARQARELAAHQLNSLLSNSLSDPLELSAQFNDVPLDIPTSAPHFSSAYSIALENRFDLKSLSLDQKNSKIRSSYLENQTRPRLDMVVSAGLNGLSGNERTGNAPIADSGPYFDSYEGLINRDGYQWTAGFMFSYPLGNREAESRASQARLDEHQINDRKGELEKAIETELRQRLTEITRIEEQFEIAERLQSLAKISLAQENRRLAEGLSDTFRVLNFQENLIDARINHLSVLIEYNKSLARYHRTLGTNLARHGILARIEQREIRFEQM